MPTTTRILVLGGGFGGVYAALELDRTIACRNSVEVTLVARDNYFLFTPMLHEVAASDLDLTHIVSPLRKLLTRVRVVGGEIEAIDLEGRSVTLWHGRDQHHHRLEFDHLVLALGSVTNFYGLPGLAEHAVTMKTLGDAIALRNRVIAFLEEADFECCAGKRRELLTFVVAGGGFAGVETAAAINDLLHEALRFYPNLSAAQVRVVLVHSGGEILPELGAKLGRYARRKLEARGVDVRLGLKVTRCDGNEVELSDGARLTSRTLVWTAGTAPSPLLASLPCALVRGRVEVNEHLAVPGRPGVWAVGDCAVVPDRRTGGTHPPTAQHALREGRRAARNIAAELRGARKRPFRFRTLGQLASLGRRTGVARVFGLNFSGFVAWWLWRTIYLSKLPRLDRKCRVALDWTLDLLFSKDIVQYQTFLASHAEAHAADERGAGADVAAEYAAPRGHAGSARSHPPPSPGAPFVARPAAFR